MGDLTLVVMAAGTGVRFGGLKQIAPVGPTGESIIDYSSFDALTAGFTKIVFVIRRDIEEAFVGAVGRRIEKHAAVAYVYQDEVEATLLSADRAGHPRGTGLALLSAASEVSGDFGLINADDYYGAESFRLLAASLQGSEDDGVMVGFRLGNTLSEFGSVKRGLCEVQPGGLLASVTEIENIQLVDHTLAGTSQSGERLQLRGSEIVSMNMWGFRSPIMGGFRSRLPAYLDAGSGEFYIPSVVTELIRDDGYRCRVVPTPSDWFGITYREDHEIVRSRVLELIRQGTYAEDLWAGVPR